MATDAEIKSVGGYDQGRPGRATGGKLACFECGHTSRLGDEFPSYLAKVKRYNTAKMKRYKEF